MPDDFPPLLSAGNLCSSSPARQRWREAPLHPADRRGYVIILETGHVSVEQWEHSPCHLKRRQNLFAGSFISILLLIGDHLCSIFVIKLNFFLIFKQSAFTIYLTMGTLDFAKMPTGNIVTFGPDCHSLTISFYFICFGFLLSSPRQTTQVNFSQEIQGSFQQPFWKVLICFIGETQRKIPCWDSSAKTL